MRAAWPSMHDRRRRGAATFLPFLSGAARTRIIAAYFLCTQWHARRPLLAPILRKSGDVIAKRVEILTALPQLQIVRIKQQDAIERHDSRLVPGESFP